MAYYFAKDKQTIESDTANNYWLNNGWTRISAKYGKQRLADNARENLLAMIQPGNTVYTLIAHVAASGMRREIRAFIPFANESGNVSIIEITHYISKLRDTKIGKHGGIVMSGCGMDMAFEIVYRLGDSLWPNGTDKPHGTRNGLPDSNGGYALRKESL